MTKDYRAEAESHSAIVLNIAPTPSQLSVSAPLDALLDKGDVWMEYSIRLLRTLPRIYA